MSDNSQASLNENINFTRYRNGQKKGHYESFFLRANHPEEPLAFWIRYTIFSPENRPDDAIGEIWASYFDGNTQKHTAVKEEFPLSDCLFKEDDFNVRVGEAVLDSNNAKGVSSSGENRITWDLSYSGNESPLFLLPSNFYNRSLPKAKSLVGLPMAVFNGMIRVNGTEIRIENWIGSQNHNWGQKHTDHYAWGQVGGFDNDHEGFFEIGTARLKIGPIWTPFMTVMVLRKGGREYRLNNILQSLRAQGSFDYFSWRFKSEDEVVRIEGDISASPRDFVGFNYYNPPGGIKHCLNTKIASCRLRITNKKDTNGTNTEILETQFRAAFEILTDDREHGVRIYA
ncbi:MAG: hypothetical protein JXB09_03170 [Deltaproteobacteria bacterium]|nr:hypothetical protein [Deltaproteobacteria bacterium]